MQRFCGQQVGNRTPLYLVRDLPQIVQIDILIIAELLIAGVANQGQFVLIRTGDALEKRGKGMAAAMGGVGVLLLAVDVKSGI